MHEANSANRLGPATQATRIAAAACGLERNTISARAATP